MFETKKSIDFIRSIIDDISQKSGVYHMIDQDGKILYIGKAKNLYKRVLSYTQVNRMNLRIESMISQIRDIKTIITESEAEAFLLESNLIKKHKPKYNILLTDDKSYPFIKIDLEHKFPSINLYRGKQDKKSKYYGPFASSYQVRDVIDLIRKIFMVRSCKDSFFKARTRPCLEYQIKRCTAPCVQKVDEMEYKQQLKYVYDFLQGNTKQIMSEFTEKMRQASTDHDYEKALLYRNQIALINDITKSQNINILSIGDSDIMVLLENSGVYIIEVFFYRNGHNYGNYEYYPKNTLEMTDSEILSAFIGQFYQDFIPPDQILVNVELEELQAIKLALKMKYNKKTEILLPKKGEKMNALKIAKNNAEISLLKKINDQKSHTHFLQSTAELFNISSNIKNIEVFDNSHIQGSYAIGAVISIGDEGFQKKNYRKYNIDHSELEPGDDYAMMEQVFSRHYGKMKKQIADDQKLLYPDLIIVDGGKGQYSVVKKILEELGLVVPLVAMSKGKERNKGKETYIASIENTNLDLLNNSELVSDFALDSDNDLVSFNLVETHELAYFLQRIRDESHRFAITTHRKKRAKSIKKSAIDDIPSVGKVRKYNLLNYFGSVERLKAAKVEDISKVDGINKSVAIKIYNYFHDN